MNWSARIDKKSDVDISGIMTYSVAMLCNGSECLSGVEISGPPESIQQLISDKVVAFAGAYEMADTMPQVGDVLSIIGTVDPTLSLPKIEGVGVPDEPVAE